MKYEKKTAYTVYKVVKDDGTGRMGSLMHRLPYAKTYLIGRKVYADVGLLAVFLDVGKALDYTEQIAGKTWVLECRTNCRPIKIDYFRGWVKDKNDIPEWWRKGYWKGAGTYDPYDPWLQHKKVPDSYGVKSLTPIREVKWPIWNSGTCTI